MGASRAPLMLNLIGDSLVTRGGPIEEGQDKPTQDAIVAKALWRVRRAPGVKAGPCSEDGEIIRGRATRNARIGDASTIRRQSRTNVTVSFVATELAASSTSR